MEKVMVIEGSIEETLASAPYGQRMKLLVNGYSVKGRKQNYHSNGCLDLKGSIYGSGSNTVRIRIGDIQAVQLCSFWSY